ncbi:MAG: hypothetical protein AB1371_04410 [Pseudomonadota bacterium]|uniref:hypothetical protein n=1 Tax=Tepidimonas thermarum TaxID=335431 RepID=UPI00163DB361|nr:hypothetical protein [Tepidimonas thermarum]
MKADQPTETLLEPYQALGIGAAVVALIVADRRFGQPAADCTPGPTTVVRGDE